MQFYYSILKAAPYLLADERNKKLFLDFFLCSEREKRDAVLAFCVLDEEVQVLIGSAIDMEERMEKQLRELLQQKWQYDSRAHEVACGGAKKLEALCIRIDGAVLPDYCRKIHRLPVQEGYVTRIRDYWWSSYQTYRGNYMWEGVDTALVLHYINAAKQTFGAKELRLIS